MPSDDFGYRPSNAAKRSEGERELIDARGSIDSRTFQEHAQISSVTGDGRDRHAVRVEGGYGRGSWNSRSSQSQRGLCFRVVSIDEHSVRGKSNGIPLFFKIAIPMIVVLLVVLIVLVVL